MIVKMYGKERDLKKGTRIIRIISNNHIYIPRKDYYHSCYSNGFNLPTALIVPKNVFKRLKDNDDIEYHFEKDGKEYYKIKE